MAARLLLAFLITACSTLASQPSDGAPQTEGGGRLEDLGGQAILHVSGTPYEMGWQHGRLLRQQIRESIKAGRGPDGGSLPRRARLPRLPTDLQDELRGIADGAGVPRGAIESLQVGLASSAHEDRAMSRAAAAWGSATADGALFLAHGLYSTGTARKRDGPLRLPLILIVASPCRGLPYACLSWPGFVGAFSGLNTAGICAAATDVPTLDRSDQGLPTPLLLKEVIRRSHTLDDAVRLLGDLPRADGANFVLGDGKTREAVAVEVTRSLCHVLRPADREEAAGCRLAIPDVVRRGGQFVHPATIATESEVRGPRRPAVPRWGDWAFDQSLIHYRGQLGPGSFIRCLSDCDGAPDALCQVVYGVAEQTLWLVEPPQAGPSGQGGGRFRKLPLGELLKGESLPAAVVELPAQPKVATCGLTQCAGTLLPLSDPDPAVNKLLALYNFPPDPFPWRLREMSEADAFTVHRLLFPSPTRYSTLETNTVHAEYYLPRGLKGKVAAVVVLDILDGSFTVARMVCRHFATAGIPSLMVKMPYYGERRPAGASLYQTFVGRPERMFEAFQGTVADVRRAACWLQERPEVDPNRIGILGVSLGGMIASTVVGVDPRFNRNVLVLGGGDPVGVLWHAPETEMVRERLIALGHTLESVRELAKGIDPIPFARRADPKQILMINAASDETVPRASTIALWEAFGKPTIQWYPAGHYSISLFIPAILPAAAHFVLTLPAPRSPATRAPRSEVRPANQGPRATP